MQKWKVTNGETEKKKERWKERKEKRKVGSESKGYETGNQKASCGSESGGMVGSRKVWTVAKARKKSE